MVITIAASAVTTNKMVVVVANVTNLIVHFCVYDTVSVFLQKYGDSHKIYPMEIRNEFIKRVRLLCDANRVSLIVGAVPNTFIEFNESVYRVLMDDDTATDNETDLCMTILVPANTEDPAPPVIRVAFLNHTHLFYDSAVYEWRASKAVHRTPMKPQPKSLELPPLHRKPRLLRRATITQTNIRPLRLDEDDEPAMDTVQELYPANKEKHVTFNYTPFFPPSDPL